MGDRYMVLKTQKQCFIVVVLFPFSISCLCKAEQTYCAFPLGVETGTVERSDGSDAPKHADPWPCDAHRAAERHHDDPRSSWANPARENQQQRASSTAAAGRHHPPGQWGAADGGHRRSRAVLLPLHRALRSGGPDRWDRSDGRRVQLQLSRLHHILLWTGAALGRAGAARPERRLLEGADGEKEREKTRESDGTGGPSEEHLCLIRHKLELRNLHDERVNAISRCLASGRTIDCKKRWTTHFHFLPM